MAKYIVIFCLAFLSLPTRAAEGDTCTNMGTVESLALIQVQSQRTLRSYTIPTGQKLEVLGSGQNNFCHVRYNNKDYLVEEHLLAKRTEGTRIKQKAIQLLSNIQNINDPNCDPQKAEATCDLIKNEKWDFDSSSLLIQACDAPKLDLVARKDVGEYTDKDCELKSKPAVGSNYWNACPHPRECNDEEAKVAYKEDQQMRDSFTPTKPHPACEVDVTEPDPEKLNLLMPAPSKQSDRKRSCILKFQNTPTRITLHHAGVPPNQGVAEFQTYHMNSHGWSDVGYHYVIGRDESGKWRVYEGRPSKYQGAHAGPGENSDSIGIVIAGDYTAGKSGSLDTSKEAELPPREAVEQLMALMEKLKKENPKLKSIAGHDDAYWQGLGCHTQCPSPGCKHVAHRLGEKYFKQSE